MAFISFISYFTSRTYTGTQYALMASISNFGRTTMAAGSGAVVDFLNGDWAFFFILTTLMVIPGLALLLWVGRLLKPFQEQRGEQGDACDKTCVDQGEAIACLSYGTTPAVNVACYRNDGLYCDETCKPVAGVNDGGFGRQPDGAVGGNHRLVGRPL